MNIELFALLREKATAKYKSVKKEMSFLRLPGLNREEPVIDTLDAESLSRYIKMQAVLVNEIQEGIQRSPSEASLLFQTPQELEPSMPSSGKTSTPSSHQQLLSPSKTVLKQNIRRGLLMLPGNVLLMRAAQHEAKRSIDFGVKTSLGRRPYMEDRHITKPSFLNFPISLACSKEIIPDFVLNELKKLGESPEGAKSQWTDIMSEMQRPKDESVQCVFDDFSLFLICDGHGGAQVAQYCTATFQSVLTELLQDSVAEIQSQLMQTEAQFPDQNGNSNTMNKDLTLSTIPERSAKSASTIVEYQSTNTSGLGGGCCFQQPSRSLRNCCSFQSSKLKAQEGRVVHRPESKSQSSGPNGQKCGLNVYHLRDALNQSFQQMDAEVRRLKLGEYEGTTALACMVGTWHICVANCGDSRAVLCRNGVAVRLTRDHKPHVEEERERIEQNGGFVINTYGCSRVNGFLAISRAIGDHLIPTVIPNPDVTILHRHHTDEFLICATDGLWDVMSDEVACQMTSRCLARAEEKGASSKVSTRVAANVLLRAALDKGSTDNITVTVVDLRNTSKV
eukprot:g824.t1